MAHARTIIPDLPAATDPTDDYVLAIDSGTKTFKISLEDLADQIASRLPAPVMQVPVGTVIFLAHDEVPEGYLPFGAEVSRETYADLFAKIGTTYGVGDGETTFNTPEARGEFPRFWIDGRRPPHPQNGRNIGTFEQDQMQRITGSYVDSSYGVVGSSGALLKVAGPHGGASMASSFGARGNIDFDSASSPDARTSASTSGETRVRNVAFKGLIKY